MDKDGILLGVKIAAGAVAALWGGLEVMVQLLLALMVVDIITGILAGGKERAISSEVSFAGMRKKALIILLVATGQLLEPTAGIEISNFIAGFFSAGELMSILENAGRAGVPIPEILRGVLIKLNPTAPPQPDGKP